MSFPSSPSNNQTAIVNGITYTFNSARNTWTRQTISAGAIDQTARNIANTANAVSQSAYAFANTVNSYSYSTNAFVISSNTAMKAYVDQANTGMASYVVASNTAMKAYVDQANTGLKSYGDATYATKTGGTITGSLSITNDLTVSGNLNILGNTTTINVSSFVVNDPLVFFAGNNFTTDTVDIGFVGHYNDGANAHTGLFRDPNLKEYLLFKNYTPEISGNNLINIADPTFAYSNLYVSTLKGNVSANTVNTISLGVSGVINTGSIGATTANITGLNSTNLYANNYYFANGVSLTTGGITSTLTLTVTNSGSGAYLIDGASNPTVTLYRGVTYYFSINASGHPFHIQTVSGAYSSGNLYTSGVTGSGTQVGTLTFTVPLDAPSNLYYVCQFHSAMNGAFIIENLISTINTQNTRINVIEGVDVTQNTRITALEGVNTTQNTNITTVTGLAQGAFDKANTGDDYARTTANTATNNITILQGVNTTQNTNITSATNLAQAAYNQANTGGGGGVSASGYLANAVIFSNTAGYLSNTSNLQFFSSNNTLVVPSINVTSSIGITNTANIGSIGTTNIFASNYYYANGVPLPLGAGGGGGSSGNVSASGWTVNSVITANSTGYLSSPANLSFITSNNTLLVTGNIIGGGVRTTSDTTPPTTATTGDMWYNTSTDIMYRYTYDGTNYYWIDTVSSATASNGSLTQANVTYTTVTANIVSTTITSNTITSNAITSNTITSNAITSNTITSNAITSNTINVTTVISSTVNTTTLNTSALYANSYYFANGSPLVSGGGGGTSTSSNTAPTSPAVGDIWYKISTDTTYRYTYDGTSNYWIDITSPTVSTTGGGTAYSRTSFTATAGQTTFSVTYTVNYIQVYVNGVLLNAADYTATSGTNIVLAVACTVGDIVETVAFTVNSVTSTTTASSNNAYADANTVIFINNNVISANANIAANKGAMSVGPVYYAAGVTVNMAANSRWVIL